MYFCPGNPLGQPGWNLVKTAVGSPRHLDGCLMLMASPVTCFACNNAMNCGDLHLAMRVGRQVDLYVDSTSHDTFTAAQLSVNHLLSLAKQACK